MASSPATVDGGTGSGPAGRMRSIRLSTGVKVFLILGAMLLPLSMISLLASASTGRTAVADRVGRLSVELESVAARLRRNLVEDQATVAASASAQAVAPPARGDALCRQATEIVRTRHRGVSGFAIADGTGTIVCAFDWHWLVPTPNGTNLTAQVSDTQLLLSRRTENGWITALRYPTAEIQRLSDPVQLDGRYVLALEGPSGSMTLHDRLGSNVRFFGVSSMTTALPGFDLALTATVPDLPPTTAQWIAIGLPILMTVGSALIGWLLVHRLFTRQLGFLTRQVEAYRPGTLITLGDENRTGASEVEALGLGLRDLSALVARSIHEVEAGLTRQTALTREVHHRVKNNLQVIASLISLHSRAAEDPGAQDAYRSIQRRVDALSVVHRNHFAGTEITSGVSLSALISELANGLQLSSDEGAGELAIRLSLVPAFVTQDVAMSVAFIVTELAELAIVCGERSQTLTVTAQAAGPSSVRLTLAAPAFVGSDALTSQLDMRYGRVLTGLSRQLRSPLEHDDGGGTFRIDVPCLTASEPAAKVPG